ncbi:tetratricopeptide repeat protein [Desulfosporosinus sp. FKA]|uniref:tetratricopeptide repeat protein n=1 Tax=Desulfosporosinus sp. FKA TaxID=1969834 RepID=UPI000B49A120|nr:tetratricopeptide repeat protein [Desulfosporosinus sp. FKA]
MENNQKSQTFKAVMIASLLIFILAGAGAYGYFKGSSSGNSLTASSASSTNSDYTGLKNRVNQLTQQVRSNPKEIQLQQDLGNAYYDLGTAARTAAPNEAKNDFVQATKYYQNVLQSKQDINVLTDMATAAFYSGQNELADKSYQKAIHVNPDFQQALFNYGVFTYQIKKNSAAAIQLWQTALTKDPNGPNADEIKQLISEAKKGQIS